MSSMSHRCGMLATLSVVALAAVAPVASAQTDQQLREDVTAREQRSDLIGAYVVMRRLQAPDAADRGHAQHLLVTLQTLNTADSLRNSGDGSAAARLLDAQIAELDPVEDRFLMVALSRSSKRAVDAARADADAGAAAALAKAKALGDDGQWAKAAAVYKSVATQPPGEISGEIRRQGMVGQLMAESEAAEREPGEIMGSVLDTLRTVLRWLLILALPLAVLLLLAGLGRLLRRFPKGGRTSIALIEVVDTDQNPNRNRAVSQDLADAIQDAQQPTLTAGLVDLRDLDGTAVPILRSDSYTVAAEPVTVDGQITIGPVGVNVAQLLSSLRRMLTRPGETVLTGIVQSDGSAVQVSLQGRRKGETLGPWSASAPTRGEAIRAVAKQYAIQCAHARATSNWLSHRAYCEAVEQLDANAGKDALMHARAALERSLAHDQANLPARLRLGAVLRLLGDNAESADQLDLLLDDLRRKDELPTLARGLVEHHPELEYLARYERNIALAKVDDRQREARAGLGELVKELESRRDDPALRQLYPVALAAWGAAHLGIGQDEMSRQAVLRRLDDIAQRIEASAGNGGRREAMAVLENARARVLFRLGRFDEARCAADRALAITPDLTDARITLASIHMKTRDPRGKWIEPTRRQLERALAVSPEDPRLLYRLGRFYDLQDEDDRAKEYYAKIPHDWKALERHADVLCRNEESEEALKLRVRAHRIRVAEGERADAMIDTFLHAGRATEDDIDAVVACATANTPAGDAPANQRLGEVTGHAKQLRGKGRGGAGVRREALVSGP